MKTQIVSIFLCALLFSTFGHEYLKAHQLAHEALLANHHHNSLLPHAAEDRFHVPEDEECGWLCPIGPNPGTDNSTSITIIINEQANIIAIANVTAKVAIAIDISANIVALFNGNTGAAIIINISTSEGVYIAAGVSGELWIAAKITIEAYIASLSSLKILWELGLKVGIHFTQQTITVLILNEISAILVELSAELSVALRASVIHAFAIVLEISGDFVKLLNGVLAGVLKGIGHLVINHLKGDLIWVINVFKGIGKLVELIPGGIRVLVDAGILLNFELIFAASSGLEVLIIILTDITLKLDISTVLGVVLNDVEAFFTIIVALGGGFSSGLDGVVKVVQQILAYIAGRLELEILIDTLIIFSVSAVAIEVDVLINLLNRLITVAKSCRNHGNLKGFIETLQKLIDGKLVIRGVNISKILSVLLRGVVTSSLDFVVQILLLLTVVVKASVAIPQLVLNLFLQLNTTVGVHVLVQLGIKIDVSVVGGGSGDLLKQIVKGLNIKQLLSHGLNITYIFSHIPIIGDIYAAVSVSVKRVSNGSINASSLFKATSVIGIKIVAWLSALLGVNLRGGGGIILPVFKEHPTGQKGEAHHIHEKHHAGQERHHEAHENHNKVH